MVESMVYVVVSVMLLAVLFLAFRNVGKDYLRSNQTVRVEQNARGAMVILVRDIHNTGLKYAFHPDGSGGFTTSLIQAAYRTDSSSFDYLDAGHHDELTAIQARVDAQGAPLGVDTLTYRVDSASGTLRRKLNGAPFEGLAPNVEALQFQYGLYASDSAFLVHNPPIPVQWSASGSAVLSASPSALVVQITGSSTVLVQNLTTLTSLQAGRTYFLEVSAEGDAAFFASLTGLEAVVLDLLGSVAASESFLPGKSMTLRRLALEPPTLVGSRIGFRIVTTGSGILRIASIRFGQADRGEFQWLDAPNTAQKKRVRAIRVQLLARSEGEAFGDRSQSFTVGNAVVEATDDKVRRVFEAVVPIPNNGVF